MYVAGAVRERVGLVPGDREDAGGVPGGRHRAYTINEGTYDIRTTQFPTALNGGLVTMTVGANTPIDLHATLTDGTNAIGSGTADTYTFAVTNAGTVGVTNAPITDTQPAGFAMTACTATVTRNCGWTCTATGGATCGAASSGNNVTAVSTTASIPAGDSVRYTVYGAITAATGSYATYTMTAGAPSGETQSIPFDNVASDTNFITGTTFEVDVTKTGTGDGLVTVNPGNSRCDVGCTAGIAATYGQNEQIAVWAIPETGDTFTGGTGGACAGTTSNPCITTVAARSTLTASFVQPSTSATIASTTHGTSTSLVRPGDTETATLTVTVPNGENAPLVITDTRSPASRSAR